MHQKKLETQGYSTHVQNHPPLIRSPFPLLPYYRHEKIQSNKRREVNRIMQRMDRAKHGSIKKFTQSSNIKRDIYGCTKTPHTQKRSQGNKFSGNASTKIQKNIS